MTVQADEVTPDMAPFFAGRFVELYQSASGGKLDYSVASLEAVDDILEGMRKEGLTIKNIYRVLFVAGCYVGEVIIRSKKLKWVKAEDSHYSDSRDVVPIVIEYADNSYTSPINKVIKRLEFGEEDNLSF